MPRAAARRCHADDRRLTRWPRSPRSPAGGCIAPAGDARWSRAVEFDSRAGQPGGLFVALPGERVDGHDFAAAAVGGRRGRRARRAARSTRPRSIVPPRARRRRHLPRRRRPDGSGAAVLAALAPARRARRRRAARADGRRRHRLVRQDLDQGPDRRGARAGSARRVAPPESFNNELGHPYTVLRADDDTRFLVLELSARGIGHIAALARIAPPRIGAVLNVGARAHRRVRLGRGHRRGQVRTGAGAARADGRRGAERRRSAGRRDGRAHRRPGWSLVGRAADAEVRAEDVTLDEPAGPGSPWSPRRARRRSRCGWSARTRSATRWPRPRSARAGGTPPTRSPRRCRRLRPASPLADGGHRPRRRHHRRSTTPTTPTRTRCAAALRALSAIGRRPADLGGARRDGRARRRGRGRARRDRPAGGAARTSTG